ncbi:MULTISPECIES: hypothetical protein [unclassified Pseudofrankia]|uniref:hypothetical protein n=1 Tax=unclassified Pseudofrankia TaxID=2994372 RepID=UPI0008DAC961|nr:MULTISPECIES: hypothetical protein [unclassified Pseudofrankia]MDT3444823.1 hypothetical protein [Pseudofrankia sp. BMG5.37]OHV45153.1 hypothetical protein BCD48_23600 [Pseudofrankia sp. BMG5.36]
MGVLDSLLTGLDDKTRARTLNMIAQSIADDRERAPEASHRRQVDTGTRTRRSTGPRARHERRVPSGDVSS